MTQPTTINDNMKYIHYLARLGSLFKKNILVRFLALVHPFLTFLSRIDMSFKYLFNWMGPGTQNPIFLIIFLDRGVHKLIYIPPCISPSGGLFIYISLNTPVGVGLFVVLGPIALL